MLENIKVGENVVAFPYGLGVVTRTNIGGYFADIEVEFTDSNGVTRRYMFSWKGEHNEYWGQKQVCWAIDGAPGWVWDYIGKPKSKDDYILMPRSLTAENGAKAALMGEFKIDVEIVYEDGSDETIVVDVPWTTIKAIYAAAVKHFDKK